MADRGFVQRILDRVFGTTRDDQDRGTPENPPPPQGPAPQPPTGDGENEYSRIYNEEVTRRTQRKISEETGFSRREVLQSQIEIFLSLPGLADEDPPDRYEFWREYLQAFVAQTRDRTAFLRTIGLNPRDFPWEEWRTATGYSRRK